jgi:hypothetical protein
MHDIGIHDENNIDIDISREYLHSVMEDYRIFNIECKLEILNFELLLRENVGLLRGGVNQ